MIIGEKKLREMYDVDEECYQPNSIDLRLEKLEKFEDTRNVGIYNDGRKYFPKMKEVETLIEEYTLRPKTAYIVTIKNMMKIPIDKMQLYFLRSSLMRMGIISTTCVGDSGFNGHLKFLLYNVSPNDVVLQKDMRIATAVTFEVDGATIYDGDFNED